MNRYFRFIATAALSAACLTSCLEKYPASSIPEDEAMMTFNDAEQHVTGIYSSLMSSALYSGSLTILPDIQADLVYAVEGNSNQNTNFWMWDIKSTDLNLVDVYGSLYTVIGNCNFYLENIGRVMANVTDDDQLDLLDSYTGEVYTIRALCYSELIKCFCKAYEPATAKELPGVVIRTSYSNSEPVRRSSLYDSYEFVKSDLEKAMTLLDEDDDEYSNNFMSMAAAQAIYARVALYMQDWDTAIEYSSLLLDNDAFFLSSTNQIASDPFSYFDYMWAYDYGTEIIWMIGFTTTSYGGALGSQFLGFTRDYTYMYPDYVPAQWVLDAYTQSDLRYDAYFADEDALGVSIGYANGLSWPLLTKYFGNRNFIQYYIYHVNMPKPLRLAEQYLIRAEAYCWKGDYTSAAKDLDELRSARMSSSGSVSLNASNWLDFISEERMRELYMEGFRLNDLKRWHRGFERKPQSCSQTEGSSLKIEADDPLFVWPIPQHELEAPGSEIVGNESNN